MIKSVLCLFALHAAFTALTDQSNADSEHIEREWNATDHIPFEQFIVQSHRGAGVLALENTIEAFELGWSLGTVPEADLRTTKDGIIVAFHDANFARVVKNAGPELQKKGVIDVTFDELSTLDVGSWKGEGFTGRRVSRMNDIFDLMRSRPKRRLYLDIKNVNLKQLAADVKSRQIGAQVILASPNHKTIREWKSLVPESDTLLWMGGDEAKLRAQFDQLRDAQFEGITQLQIHIHPNKDQNSQDQKSREPFQVSRSFLTEVGWELRARKILLQTLPYTSDPTFYGKLLDVGVASFATDHPEVAMREIKNYYEKRQSTLPSK